MRIVDAASILIAATQAGIAAALGAQVAGFSLPPAVIFVLVVSGAMLAVISANLPAVLMGRVAPVTMTHVHTMATTMPEVNAGIIDPSAGLAH